ncbi:MAG: hypothetical protein GXP08_07685 [Gammaproteobacteria bacterium]|nr:hypothetical protein [Gammaproteobacteria bacterium]
MNELKQDRLYELLPTVYRMRDAEQGEPLKALLRVISEQVNLVEDDISQLYENWFIETCEDWVVSYIGDLIGYEPVDEAGEPSAVDSLQGRQRNKILIPRREVANTIRYRRRKGSLALLELLANDVAGWPARAVECYKLLGWTQSLNHQRPDRGQTVDLRQGSTLDLINSPFDTLAHTVDVRRINSHHSKGYYNIPSVGLFVWRLKSFPVTQTPAYCQEAAGPNRFTFSVLGNDAPLYMNPEPETDPTHIADEFNLPVPIRRRLFEEQKEHLYGEEKSLQIWKGMKDGKKIVPKLIPFKQIIAADLSDWHYIPRRGMVAVDPVLGRIAFPSRQFPKNGVWVSYHYGFSMDMGGGEYQRTLSQPTKYTLFRVGKDSEFKTISAALEKWREKNERHAVIEMTDSGVYVEPVVIDFSNNNPEIDQRESLQLRAANRQRPVIRLLDWNTDKPDSLTIIGARKARVTLDGLMITGRGVQVSGDLSELTIRHSTLVPGWTLDSDCEPQRSTEPSLEIFSPNVCVKIEHSILGAIQIDPTAEVPLPEPDDGDVSPDDELTDTETTQAHCQPIDPKVRLDPMRICISDSILDATDPDIEVLSGPGCLVAHACLTILRSTVFGQIQIHAIELAENTLFNGRITVARRQKGCLRFCYVTPESRTPRRYRCQPDLVEKPIKTRFENSKISEADKDRLIETERLRVKPKFNSVRYSTPTYCQLADCCADEIKRGADDESEMGVFHDLYQPQRAANLRVRVDEYLPARMDVGIIFSS